MDESKPWWLFQICVTVLRYFRIPICKFCHEYRCHLTRWLLMNKMSRYWLGWRLGTCTTPSISLSRCSLTANCAFTRLSDNLYTISFGFKRLYQCFTCYTVWWPKTVFIMFSHYRHYFTGYLDIAVASCSFEKVKLSKFCLSPTNTMTSLGNLLILRIDCMFDFPTLFISRYGRNVWHLWRT